jgi:branched-chain amino acid transport system substrate-binding protein
MELAVGELNQRPTPPAAAAGRTASPTAPTPETGTVAPERAPADAAGSRETAPDADAGASARTTPPDESAPPRQPVSAPTLRVLLEVQDVHPLDTKDAVADFGRLAAAGVTVVFTASPTPTLAVYPLAAARDVLVVHQGLRSERFPAASQTLFQIRPSVAARGEALAGYAWERGLRRLALLAAGDEFGRPARGAVAARWRERGGSLVHDESLHLDAPDLTARLGRVARLAPDAVCLAFRGQELGDLARRLREAGYPGLLLALDDDPALIHAAGPAVSDLVLLSDAFMAEPDAPSALFARTYEAKFGRAPSRFAANAYDAVTILAEGARLALQGRRDPPGGGRLREAILARRAFPSIYGGQVVVRDDGSFERPFALFTVSAGRATFLGYVTPAGRPRLEGRAPSPGPGALRAG